MNNRILYTTLLLFCILQVGYAQNMKHKAIDMTPKQPSDLFIGAVLDSKSLNSGVYKFVETPFADVIITSTIPGVRAKTIVPTYDNMMMALSESVTEGGGELNGNQSFSFSIRELSSYGDLSMYWGQQIDLLDAFGILADQKSKNLVAVEVSLALFSIDMDLPTAPPAETSNDNIYVGSISFGRKVIVVVESDFALADVITAIKDMLDRDDNLLESSKAIVANSTFRIMNIGNKAIEASDSDNPLSGVADYVGKVGTATDFGIPISFGGAYVNGSAQFENNF